MADINLLPEELREREQAARRGLAGEPEARKFSSPKEKARAAVEGSPPGRWQQLISALKKNVTAPAGDSQATPLSPKPSVSAAPKSTFTPPPPQTPPPPPAEPTAEFKPKSYSPATETGAKTPPTSLPPILDVNLLPAQEGRQLSRQNIKIISYAILVTLFLLTAIYFALRGYVWQKEAANTAVQQEIISLQQQLESARFGAEQAMMTQRRLKAVEKLLSQRHDWNGFFSFLEKNTITVVELTSLAADANGRVTVSGQAPNFTEVGRQMLAWEQAAEVAEVNLSGMAVEGKRDSTGLTTSIVKFTFAIILSPSLFLASSQ